MINLQGLTPQERAVVDWQYRNVGGFYQALWLAITRADDANLDALERAFPVEVSGYRRYIGEAGWWRGVEAKLEKEAA